MARLRRRLTLLQLQRSRVAGVLISRFYSSAGDFLWLNPANSMPTTQQLLIQGIKVSLPDHTVKLTDTNRLVSLAALVKKIRCFSMIGKDLRLLLLLNISTSLHRPLGRVTVDAEINRRNDYDRDRDDDFDRGRE